MLTAAGETVIRFLYRKTGEICNGGLPTVFRKCRAFLALPLATPVVLIVHVLQPLILLRKVSNQ